MGVVSSAGEPVLQVHKAMGGVEWVHKLPRNAISYVIHDP